MCHAHWITTGNNVTPTKRVNKVHSLAWRICLFAVFPAVTGFLKRNTRIRREHSRNIWITQRHQNGELNAFCFFLQDGCNSNQISLIQDSNNQYWLQFLIQVLTDTLWLFKVLGLRFSLSINQWTYVQLSLDVLRSLQQDCHPGCYSRHSEIVASLDWKPNAG